MILVFALFGSLGLYTELLRNLLNALVGHIFYSNTHEIFPSFSIYKDTDVSAFIWVELIKSKELTLPKARLPLI